MKKEEEEEPIDFTRFLQTEPDKKGVSELVRGEEKGRDSEEKVTKTKEGNTTGVVLLDAKKFWIPESKPAFIVAHPNPTSIHMLENGIFEKNLIEWSKQFVCSNKDCLDIGAHCGTYALSLAPLCRNVYAFEAQRMTYYQLCGGIALNYYKNVWPYNVALGEKDGEVTLHVTSNDGGGSTVQKEWLEKQQSICIESEKCVQQSLDSFFLK